MIRLVLMCALCLIAPSVGEAGTIVVTNTGDSGAGTLRDSLAASTDGDLVDATAITGTVYLTSGELVIMRSITLRGPGMEQLAVDGGGSNRVLLVAGYGTGANVYIDGMTFTNGFADKGGGIYNDNGTVVLNHCKIVNNAANKGGGVFNNGEIGIGEFTMLNCVLSDNVATNGAGIYNYGFHGAVALSIVNSLVRSNAVLQYHGDGGGVMNDGFLGNASCRVANSAFVGNTAGFGGGISSVGSDGNAGVSLMNSTFSRNQARDYGGGVQNYGVNTGHASLAVRACTFSENSAFIGYGIYNVSIGGFATTDLGTTILNSGGIDNNAGTVTSAGYNLCSDAGNGFFTGPSDLTNTIPMLVALQDNGGPTPTHALLPGSPAVDAAPHFIDIDQRGSLRSDAANDIGAFEFQPAPPMQCADLAGTCSNIVQSCRNLKHGYVRCRLKGVVTITNAGSVDASDFQVRYDLSGDGLLGTLLKIQKRGRIGRRMVRVRLPLNTNASGSFLVAAIDPGNAVDECDESSNLAVSDRLP